jgi:UDP-N-acetylmuramoyl-L-alanyl-D-glutamate--2,6-diaminopimelate ligase
MRRAGVKTCVMEVSSHALDQHRVHGLQFELALFTQLTQDHLDYHKNFENYFTAKRRLFVNDPAPRHALVNGDCPYGRRLLADLAGAARSFGILQPADYQATEIETSFQGSFFKLKWGERAVPFQIRLPLGYNVSNVMAVLGAIDLLGFDPEDFRGVLQEIPGIPGRLERVPGDHGFEIFVDYAHTPDAFARVLGEARKLAPRRILTLFGCGGDRDRSKRHLMTEAACRFSDLVVLTSDNPRSEDPEEILQDMRQGLPKAGQGGPEVHEIIDRAEAIRHLIALAEPGDVLFVLGKGHEDYQILGEKKIPFDDRLIAAECLQRKGRVFLP